MKPLFLDTTLQIDRLFPELDSDKAAKISHLLSQFDYTLACAYSRLEYKRVVLQNLSLALNYLVNTGSYFLALAKANKNNYRTRRRDVLINIFAWVGMKTDGAVEVSPGDSDDARLALRGQSYIRNAIMWIWYRFDKAVDSVVDGMKCKRATEAPKGRSDGSYDVSIPESQCRKKECDIGNFVQARFVQIEAVCAALERTKKDTPEKFTAECEGFLAGLRAALKNASRLYDYRNCLQVADVLIHLECTAAGVADIGTTNYKESQVLCPPLKLEMRTP